MTAIYQEYGALIEAVIRAHPAYGNEQIAACIQTPEAESQLVPGVVATLRNGKVHQDEYQNVSSGPTHEAIQLRAYQLYEERGRVHGHALEDWIAAEAQLTGLAQPRPK